MYALKGYYLIVTITNLQNLLRLNPRVQVKGSVVPSAVTKEEKKHWKRNSDKSCQVHIRINFAPI